MFPAGDFIIRVMCSRGPSVSGCNHTPGLRDVYRFLFEGYEPQDRTTFVGPTNSILTSEDFGRLGVEL